MDLNMTTAHDDPNASLDASTAGDKQNVSFSDSTDKFRAHASEEVGSPTTINQSISDPTTELTEEDIFRMKAMSIEQNGWKHGLNASEVQSAVSQVDSASNYIADAGDQQSDEQQSDEESDEEGEAEDEEVGPEGMHVAAAASDESTRHLERRFYVDSKVFLYDGFAFGRNRSLKPNLNKNTVSLLKYPFEPATIPSGIDSDEFRRAFSDAQVYLVGTAHFSLDSCRDVMQTVTETQPDFVMVELCSSRIQILSMDEQILMREAQALTRQKIMAIIRENGIAQGLMQVLLLSLSAHITQQLGMAPGGEFRAANAASKQRALGALGPLQRLKFFFHLAASLGMDIKQEDVERCKDMDMLEELLKQMAGEFPQISRILVDERDQYMTQVLHTLLQRGTMEKLYASKKCRATFEPVTVVAVVGMGHVAGIRANWTKHIDGAVLLTVPRPSVKSRIFKSALKLTFFGLLGYGVWRVGCSVVSKIRPK
uniref:TraB domain-containing protein n=1 Tax=Globodera pallida TaxID=36090 RepID=A0A183BSW7_GLOPA